MRCQCACASARNSNRLTHAQLGRRATAQRCRRGSAANKRKQIPEYNPAGLAELRYHSRVLRANLRGGISLCGSRPSAADRWRLVRGCQGTAPLPALSGDLVPGGLVMECFGIQVDIAWPGDGPSFGVYVSPCEAFGIA